MKTNRSPRHLADLTFQPGFLAIQVLAARQYTDNLLII
jgi:hypothetical protein